MLYPRYELCDIMAEAISVPPTNQTKIPPTTTPVNGNRILDLILAQDVRDHKSLLSNCGKKQRITGSSYTYLVKRVSTAHPETFLVASTNQTHIASDTCFTCSLRQFHNYCGNEMEWKSVDVGTRCRHSKMLQGGRKRCHLEA